MVIISLFRKTRQPIIRRRIPQSDSSPLLRLSSLDLDFDCPRLLRYLCPPSCRLWLEPSRRDPECRDAYLELL